MAVRCERTAQAYKKGATMASNTVSPQAPSAYHDGADEDWNTQRAYRLLNEARACVEDAPRYRPDIRMHPQHNTALDALDLLIAYLREAWAGTSGAGKGGR